MLPRLALAVLLLTGATLPPRPCRADAIDEAVAAFQKRSHVPGLTLAVAKDGQVVKRAAYGLANVELNAPATAATIYEIGSITKSFTATVVMDLVEEGKIVLDEPIPTYLPDLPEAWKGVTVRHLLTHTSGIPSYTEAGDFLQLARTEHKPEEIVAMVSAQSLDFSPGERWAYCNTGYYLLGLIVEKVAGAPFARVLSERVLEPLDLKHTRPNVPSAVIPNRSAGYGRMFGVLLNRDSLAPSSAAAAGFLLSDVDDLLKWADAQQQDRILTSESRRLMTTPVTLNDGSTNPYGFGWVNRKRLGHRRIDHGGGTAGFSSLLTSYPDDGLSIAILANLSGDPNLAALEQTIARHYLPALDLGAAAPIEDPDPDAAARIRAAIADLMDGDWDPAPFSPEFAKFLRGDPVKAMIKGLGREGELGEMSLLTRNADTQSTVRSYRVLYGTTRYLGTVVLDADGKIVGLLFEKDE